MSQHNSQLLPGRASSLPISFHHLCWLHHMLGSSESHFGRQMVTGEGPKGTGHGRPAVGQHDHQPGPAVGRSAGSAVCEPPVQLSAFCRYSSLPMQNCRTFGSAGFCGCCKFTHANRKLSSKQKVICSPSLKCNYSYK